MPSRTKKTEQPDLHQRILARLARTEKRVFRSKGFRLVTPFLRQSERKHGLAKGFHPFERVLEFKDSAELVDRVASIFGPKEVKVAIMPVNVYSGDCTWWEDHPLDSYSTRDEDLAKHSPGSFLFSVRWWQADALPSEMTYRGQRLSLDGVVLEGPFLHPHSRMTSFTPRRFSGRTDTGFGFCLGVVFADPDVRWAILVGRGALLVADQNIVGPLLREWPRWERSLHR